VGRAGYRQQFTKTLDDRQDEDLDVVEHRISGCEILWPLAIRERVLIYDLRELLDIAGGRAPLF
jgi:hypothetical protein